MMESQSGAANVSQADVKPKIGRKRSRAFEELNFELSKDNGKYEAICKLCNKRLQNTAALRLQCHRNKCNITDDGAAFTKQVTADKTPVSAKKLKVEKPSSQDISIDAFLEHTATYNDVSASSAWSVSFVRNN